MRALASPQPKTPAVRPAEPVRVPSAEPDQIEERSRESWKAVRGSSGQFASAADPESPDDSTGKPSARKSPRPGWDLGRISIFPSAAGTKFAIHPAGDQYEVEADRVAKLIMNTEGAVSAPIVTEVATTTCVQRKCECGGTCFKCKAEEVEHDDKKHKHLQRKAVEGAGPSPPMVSHSVDPVLNCLNSSGVPLDAGTRAFMEPRFGRDFSQIRIHADSTAAQSARAIQARAYTVGRHVVFAERQFAPETRGGRELLAHELVHTLQQSTIRSRSIQRSPTDAPAKEQHKPKIVKIVAFEADKREAVAYVAYAANATLEQEAATAPERVSLKENKLKQGDYTLHHDERKKLHYTGIPTEFVWYNPWLSPSEHVSRYDLAETVKITILPNDIRSFLEKDGGVAPKDSDIIDTIRAAEILVKYDISPEDLRKGEHKANDYGHHASEIDPVLWAQNLADTKVKDEKVALTNRQTFLAAAKRLSKIQGKLDAETAALYLTDPEAANLRFLRSDVHPMIKAVGDHSGYYLEGTDFEDKADLQATATMFGNALDFELRALAEAVLSATEAAILLADSKFTGAFGTTKGHGRLIDELEKLKQDPEVKQLQKQIAYEEAHPPQIDPREDLKDGLDEGSFHSAMRHLLPMEALVSDQREAEKEQDVHIDQLKKRLNDTVNEKSSLSVAGLKGFDAYDFLPKSTEKVRSQLSSALVDGIGRVDTARQKLRNDKKFVYGADQIIALEKAQLHVTAGSSLDTIIDGIVQGHLDDKTTWESVVEVINIVAALPIPPPAGPILRAVAAGINIGESIDKYAQNSLAADVSFKKEHPSASGLALDIVITATGSIADLASIESHTAASAGHDFIGVEGGVESGVVQDAAAGRKAEDEGANLAAKQKEVEGATESLHLPPDVKAEKRTANELKEKLAEHPPTEKDIHGLPGQREAEFAPGHKVQEVRTPTGIQCEIHSPTPYINATCPPGMGDLTTIAAETAARGPSKQLTADLNHFLAGLPRHVTLPQKNRLATVLIAAGEAGVPIQEDQFHQIAKALGGTKDAAAAEEVLDSVEQNIETHLNVRDSYGEGEVAGGGSRPGDIAAELPEGTHGYNKSTKNPRQVSDFLKRYPKVEASPDSEAALDALYSHTRSGAASQSPRPGRFVPTETRPAAAELESIIELSERPDVVKIELKPSSYEGRTTDKIIDIRQPDESIVRMRYEDTTITGSRTGYRPRGKGGSAEAGIDRIESAVRGKIASTPRRPSQFDALMTEAPQGGTLAVHIQRPGAGGAADVDKAMKNLGKELMQSSVQAVEFYLPGDQPLRRQILRYVRQPDKSFTLIFP